MVFLLLVVFRKGQSKFVPKHTKRKLAVFFFFFNAPPLSPDLRSLHSTKDNLDKVIKISPVECSDIQKIKQKKGKKVAELTVKKTLFRSTDDN